MARAIEDHTDDELRALIANHKRHRALTAPRYLEALDEYAKRKGQGLDVQTSIGVIRAAAEEGRFLSYTALTEQSGIDWSKVRYALNAHLGHIVDYAHGMGWPMLSAIVVNQRHLSSGGMDKTTLRGFAEAARWLGYTVPDEKGFLIEQQDLVFAWAGGRRPEGSGLF